MRKIYCLSCTAEVVRGQWWTTDGREHCGGCGSFKDEWTCGTKEQLLLAVAVLNRLKWTRQFNRRFRREMSAN
jgi:hypothetical protein